jgi:hypothetical protein
VLPLVSPTFEQLETIAKVCSVRGFACYLYDLKTELIKTTCNLAPVLLYCSGIPAEVLHQDEDVPRRRNEVIIYVWNEVSIISDILDSYHTD